MKKRGFVLTAGAIVGLSLLAGSLAAGGVESPQAALNMEFEGLIDRYLEEVRGVGASSAPRDLSAESFERVTETKRRLLAELRGIDRDTLTFDQYIDHRFLESILASAVLEEENVQRWRQDPRVYLNNRAVAYKVIVDPSPIEVRAEGLISDLQMLRTRLENGKANLNQYIARWVELSDAFIDGFLVVLENDLPKFAERVGDADLRQRLLAENNRAIAALGNFSEHINSDLSEMPVGDYRIGAEVFNGLMETRYMFPEDNIHLRRIARGMPGFTRFPAYREWGLKQFEIVKHHLEVKAARIDPDRTWLEILRDEKEDHFFAEQLVFKHLEAARASRDWVIDNDLVTIPWDDDDSIMQAADPSLWMSQWWGWGPGVPAGQTEFRKSAWTIIPVNPEWPDQQAEGNLTEKDAMFMYAIATHEVYPGHHLQRLYANEIPRRLRQYESSYSNQSWCYYIEWELTPDPQYGWFPADKQDIYALETLRLKLWRFDRVIIDSGIHASDMSYDDALELEMSGVGFVEEGSRINMDGIVSRIGSTMAAPTLGYFQWMLLREDYFQKMRELNQRGTLKDFHDRVYRIGFMPVVLVREAMFHELEQQFGQAISN